MRALGIDFGDARVGLAISDQLGAMAHPLQTLPNQKTLIGDLKSIVAKEGVDRIVIGLPKNMDGSFGPAAEKTRKFGDQLKAELPGTQIVFLDERLTTVAAQRALHSAGRNVKNSRKIIDQVAAQILLQNYLDSLEWSQGA